MASFAVDRNSMNRGTGEKSGVWIFEEFMFADSVFGRAVVEYDATAVRVKNEDREVRALMSAPYEIAISDPRITILEIHNDDGECIWSLNEFNEKNPDLKDVADLQLKNELQAVLDAFAAVESDVISFEMGLL